MTPRILTPADYPAIRVLGGPVADILDDPVKVATLSDTILMGVETPDGVLVAYWMVFTAYHLEPLYVGEAYRTQPAVARSLLEGMRELIAQLGVQAAYAAIEPANLATHQVQAERLGFRRVPAELFVLEVTHGSSGYADLGGGGGGRDSGGREQAAAGAPAEPPDPRTQLPRPTGE